MTDSALLTVAKVMHARLLAAPAFGVDADSIRRSHRIHVDRAHSPAVHVVVGGVGDRGKARGECVEREMRVTVAIVARSDDALDAADPILRAVVARLAASSTSVPAYPAGVIAELRGVEIDEQTADLDAMRIDVYYSVRFSAHEDLLDLA